MGTPSTYDALAPEEIIQGKDTTLYVVLDGKAAADVTVHLSYNIGSVVTDIGDVIIYEGAYWDGIDYAFGTDTIGYGTAALRAVCTVGGLTTEFEYQTIDVVACECDENEEARAARLAAKPKSKETSLFKRLMLRRVTPEQLKLAR